ncbi:Store-operated calcium entry regulator STIMATE (STIM-activating enhancer encoded by TMEM110) (Transmembrane protein 110), partial [Durusdinium trenchii]
SQLQASDCVPASALPKMERGEISYECYILAGVTGKVTQFVLFLCCCAALLLKWSQFHDGRDFFEFLMDSSKQLIGAGWIHILNLLFAKKLESHFESSGGDECDWYWINIVVDCTLGVGVTFLLLQLSMRLISMFLPDQVDDFRTGEYRVNGSTDAGKYVKQLAVWLVIVSSMKVLMVVFMAVGHSTLLALAQIALAPFGGSPNLKLLVAMIATPFCMNALQFWVTDNFIKKQGGMTEEEDDDIELDERGGRTKIDHGDL